jgi:DNA mismatch repair ATPase MutL
MEKEAIKGVYQVDVNGSPTKMVVLSAKNNDMLAQIFKITASTLTKSPIYTGKTSNRQSSRKNSNYKDPLRNQTNDI